MSKYPLVDAAARHMWSKDGQEVFREFTAKHAHKFVDAPLIENSGEQNLEFYDLYTKYLKLYEEQLSDFVESLGGNDREFFEQLSDVQEDTNIKDKKLVHFVNYLVACTDYPAFYKLMVRAAKKINNSESKDDGAKASDSKRSSKGSGSSNRRAEGKDDDDDDDDESDYKASHK